MRAVSLCLLILAFGSNVLAATRAPGSAEEGALLYWRYLCREQPQTETSSGGLLELTCFNQRWKVRASVRDGRVSEVQDAE